MDNNTLNTLGVPLAAAWLAQLITNYAKGTGKVPVPKLVLPLIAIAVGTGLSALYGMAEGLTFNRMGVGKVLIQGVLAGCGAVFGHEADKNAT